MTDKLITYRDNALATMKPRREYGLLLAPKAIPPHRCARPGYWFALWRWMTGRGIPCSSLWRCQCGKVWAYLGSGDWASLAETSARNRWERLGGLLVAPSLLPSVNDDDDEDEDEDDDEDEDNDDEED